MAEAVSRKARIVNPLGLHIRPSRKFAACAKDYDARVTVRNQDREAAADSQLDLLMLLATRDSEIEIIAEGPDAEAALDALCALVAEGFGEGTG